MGWDRWMTALGAAGLIACSGSDDDRTWIAPLDGQSGVQASVELMVVTPELGIPSGYPVPDMFRVVDLDQGGLVEGLFVVESDRIRFAPTGGWPANRSFAWTLDIPESVPHGPELTLPSSLHSTGVFRTKATLDMLGATVDQAGLTCIALSRTLDPDDAGPLVVTLDDVLLEDATFELLDPAEQGQPYDLHEDDAGIDTACLMTATTVTPGSTLRVWFGDYGPWRAIVQGGSLETLINELRWGGFE